MTVTLLDDAKKSNLIKYNEKLKSNFGLEIKEDGGEFNVIVYSLDTIQLILSEDFENFCGKSASIILPEKDSKTPKNVNEIDSEIFREGQESPKNNNECQCEVCGKPTNRFRYGIHIYSFKKYGFTKITDVLEALPVMP
ncbi:MAG: hypothetical protein QXP55_05040 [Nitrososphaerales archaeon]